MQHEKLSILLVDDESLARVRMESLLGETGVPFELAGSVDSVKAALNLMQSKPVDVIFLDIQMPVLDGFDLVGMLKADESSAKPYIIFVTAFDEFAIRAFEVNALDYLTKPVRLERLKQALERIGSQRDMKQNLDGLQEMVSDRKKTVLSRVTLERAGTHKPVEVSGIYYFESTEKIVYAHIDNEKGRVNFSLDELEGRLDRSLFLRTHRSSIVNLREIKEVYPWFAGTWKIRLKSGTELPVARRRVKDLKELLGF